MSKKIAVLAVQGAFIEHERTLAKLGANASSFGRGLMSNSPTMPWFCREARARRRRRCCVSWACSIR